MSLLHSERTGGSDEWYTPPEAFNALGFQFDLDPCSPGAGKCYVPADRVLTVHDDDADGSASFVWACVAAGLDPEAVRKELRDRGIE